MCLASYLCVCPLHALPGARAGAHAQFASWAYSHGSILTPCTKPVNPACTEPCSGWRNASILCQAKMQTQSMYCGKSGVPHPNPGLEVHLLQASQDACGQAHTCLHCSAYWPSLGRRVQRGHFQRQVHPGKPTWFCHLHLTRWDCMCFLHTEQKHYNYEFPRCGIRIWSMPAVTTRR